MILKKTKNKVFSRFFFNLLFVFYHLFFMLAIKKRNVSRETFRFLFKETYTSRLVTNLAFA
jgi:hypothetical protein